MSVSNGPVFRLLRFIVEAKFVSLLVAWAPGRRHSIGAGTDMPAGVHLADDGHDRCRVAAVGSVRDLNAGVAGRGSAVSRSCGAYAPAGLSTGSPLEAHTGSRAADTVAESPVRPPPPSEFVAAAPSSPTPGCSGPRGSSGRATSFYSLRHPAGARQTSVR